MSSTRSSPGNRGRLISLALVLAFLGLAGVAAFAFFSYREALSQLVIERDQQLAYLSASRLSDEFAKFTEVLDSVAESPGLAAADRLQRRRALQDSSARLSVFDGGAVLLDNFGTVVGAEPARPEIIGTDWSDRDFFRDLLVRRRFVLSDATRDGPDGSWVVVMAVPLRSENGEFLGALAGMFRLGESTISPFYASIVRLRLGESGNTYLIDGSGRILYDSGASGIGQELDDQAPPEGLQDGGSGALRLRDRSGRDVIRAYAPIPATEWVLVTEDDWARLMASVQTYARTLLILLLAASLLPALAVILTLRQKNREIRLHERQLQEDRVAELIRTSLRPTHPPLLPGWSLAVFHLPAHGVGGDFFDHYTLADGRIMAAVGTVRGDSVDSSVIMAVTRTALRGSALRMISPDEALGCSNELLCPDLREGTTVDCVLTSLDPASAALTFALAGGETTILRSTEPEMEAPPPGPPLGEELDAAFAARSWQIAPGEVVLLISSGATRAGNGGQSRNLSRALLGAVHGAQNASAAQAAVEAQLAASGGSPDLLPTEVTVLCLVRHSHA